MHNDQFDRVVTLHCNLVVQCKIETHVAVSGSFPHYWPRISKFQMVHLEIISDTTSTVSNPGQVFEVLLVS